MPKRKGLGRDINRSLEIIDTLLGSLREFHGAPIKKGLDAVGVPDEEAKDIVKLVNDAKEKSSELHNAAEDLKRAIAGIKTTAKNSRFAGQRVLAMFLDRQ